MEAEAGAPHAKKRRTGSPEWPPEEIASQSPLELKPAADAAHPEPTFHGQEPPPVSGGEGPAAATAVDAPQPSRGQEPPPVSRGEGPATANALHPEPSSHVQEPPSVAGGQEGDGVDRISSLPDAVLGEIISLLPTAEAARTRALASRWRHLWLSAPLNLDHSSLPSDEQVQAGIISQILGAHPGPARRLSVPPAHLYHRPAAVDAWLRYPALDNLQELEFIGGEIPCVWSMLPLPAPVFRFSATLRVATFCKCNLESVENLHFPQLRQLGLEFSRVSDTSLHSIIAGCPILECLLIDTTYGFDCLRVNSPSLRSICMTCAIIKIEDAPSLQRVLQLQPDSSMNVTVVSAPKLETLGCLCDDGPESKVVFGTTVIQILAISNYNLSLDMVINLMRCFPCLEKLYIQSFVATDKNLWRRKHRDLIRCLDICLKTVVLKNYQGKKSQVNFATFFVLNAKMLEVMRFEGESYEGNEMFIAKQHRLLQLEKRASRCAQFYFTSDRRCQYARDLTHIKHVTDMSTTDPFECRC
ncbi:hypothetical protein ACP70R_041482 [Stipagrostis hirtigluma subsp. patula]